MDYQIINSEIADTASIYQGARIQSSQLKQNTIVGNFSRVDFSCLGDFCRVDRNNHLFKITLGRYSYTGMNAVIMHSNIGAFCSISWNVSIGGANHDYTRIAQHSFLYNIYDNIRPESTDVPYDRFQLPVTIGNDVWIGSGAVIMRGVLVGDGAVIGANSVVTNDVPPYAIVVGSPARVIKYRFKPEVIELLLKLKWWSWPIDKIKANFILLSNQPDIKNLQEMLKDDSI
jgi:acetyltransferase-like isoleucine patch superfamily enzyme